MEKGKATKTDILVLLGFIVVICIWLIIITPKIGKDKGKYNYCVEWEGWIYREHLLFNCYDIEKQEIKCRYNILDDGRLIVELLNGTQGIYNCSDYLKSMEVI